MNKRLEKLRKKRTKVLCERAILGKIRNAYDDLNHESLGQYLESLETEKENELYVVYSDIADCPLE